jgi:hypothetical protein
MMAFGGSPRRDSPSRASTFQNIQMLEIQKVIGRLRGQSVGELLRQYSQDSIKKNAVKAARPVQPRDEKSYNTALLGAQKSR